MNETQARALLRKACDEAGSIRAFAAKHDLSAAYVSDVLLERRDLGPAICRALGIERHVATSVSFTKRKEER